MVLKYKYRFYIIPHDVTTDSAIIWLGRFSPSKLYTLKGLKINVFNKDEHRKIPVRQKWSYLGRKDHKKAGISFQTISLKNLIPNKDYHVIINYRVKLPGVIYEYRGSGTFCTLPDGLPVENKIEHNVMTTTRKSKGDRSTRPLSILAGSCFDYISDKRKVGKAYLK